ncbi:MAG: polyhydroxyalkanoic acid system family protein [Rhodothermales bacterium]|nr:polyhydroxyalkanoic acid system family protein [Rhodothermales bacterium]
MAVEIHRPHTLGRAKTRQMVEAIAASLEEKLKLRHAWQGDRLVFRRTGLDGHIDVEDHAVHVYVRKGRLLPVSEGWIRQQVEAVMDEYLG